MTNFENGSPAPQKPEGGHKPPKPYKIKIDGKMFEVEDRYITGREILVLAQKTPINQYEVGIKEHGNDVRIIGLDEQVDLEMPGIEKFVTIQTGHTDGEEGPQAPSLLLKKTSSSQIGMPIALNVSLKETLTGC